MRTVVKLFLILFWDAATGMLWAHQTALSYLQVQQMDQNSFSMQVKKPLKDLGKEDLKIEFPQGCILYPQRQFIQKGYQIKTAKIVCDAAAMAHMQVHIANLRERDIGVIFTYHSSETDLKPILVTASNPYISLKRTDSVREVIDFVRMGIMHILTGYDHLLFVLSLLLLIESMRRLLATITAFTIAHSVTLGLATFGLIHFSVAYDEALIALSIIFLAREILTEDKETLTYRFPWIVALLFGLIHGMGFATALREVGIPSEHRIGALFLFNAGVEIGQLLFIASILGLSYIFSKFGRYYVGQIRKVTLYGIGVTSAFWFIERLGAIF